MRPCSSTSARSTRTRRRTPRAVPIYATTSYVFRDSAQAAGRFGLTEPGNIYTRLMNPTSSVFERAHRRPGGRRRPPWPCATGCRRYLPMPSRTSPRQGTTSSPPRTSTAARVTSWPIPYGSRAWRRPSSTRLTPRTSSRPSARTRSCSTPRAWATPIPMSLTSKRIAAVAHAHGIPLIVDSTFATPYLLRPIEHGADVVVHSATKFIGGHGTVMGGVIVDSGKFDWTQNDKFPGLTQPNPSYHGVVFSEAVR